MRNCSFLTHLYWSRWTVTDFEPNTETVVCLEAVQVLCVSVCVCLWCFISVAGCNLSFRLFDLCTLITLVAASITLFFIDGRLWFNCSSVLFHGQSGTFTQSCCVFLMGSLLHTKSTKLLCVETGCCWCFGLNVERESPQNRCLTLKQHHQPARKVVDLCVDGLKTSVSKLNSGCF